MNDSGEAEEERERAKKERDGGPWLTTARNTLEHDGLDTPSRTASLTPTMARNLEKRAAKERSLGDQESATDKETIPNAQQETGSAKPNRKVRPTRRGSTQSFGQTPHAMSVSQTGRTGPSPIKKASADSAGEGNAGLSTSVSSSHSKSGLDGNNTLAHLPVSTDNLLLHLHTDPRSSHITLSASAGAGAKLPPPTTVNPALLRAGGGGRSRAASSSSPSKVDKGKAKADAMADGFASRSSSRSVSKQPSVDKISEAQKGYTEPELRQSPSTSRLSLNRSFSSAPLVSQGDERASSPSAISDAIDSVGITPSEASATASSPGPDSTDPMGYFDHRPRAASSSMMSRGSNSHDPRSTTTTPGEDWPSHDTTHETVIGDRGYTRQSSDFRQDLVAGALAGTPRFDADGESHLSPSAVRVTLPRTDTDSTEPESGLVAVAVSDSTAVKLETLIPGDLADKIEETEDVTTKQAILEAMREPMYGDQPTSTSAPRAPAAATAGLGFVNVDLAEANIPSPTSHGASFNPGTGTDASETGLNNDSAGEACIDEFSNLLAGAMTGTGRRSSTASSTSSSSRSRKGPTLIGTAGTLGDSGE